MSYIRSDLQTPKNVCRYMAEMIPPGAITVLEPTPGDGNLVNELFLYDVTAPGDFFLLDFASRFDCVVMNPPFSDRNAFIQNATAAVLPEIKGMRLGYWMLNKCMEMSDNVIALMPWFTVIDSDARMKFIKNWGLISVTSLPRKTFNYLRIQTVIFQLQKGYTGETSFKYFDK